MNAFSVLLAVGSGLRDVKSLASDTDVSKTLSLSKSCRAIVEHVLVGITGNGLL